MDKDFDLWNMVKKNINAKRINDNFFFSEGEIWWCHVGLNVGVETDGKEKSFRRPILIIKKFNKEMFWVMPLTSREKSGGYYHRIDHNNGPSWICLSQLKALSTKRLIKKVGMISDRDFEKVVQKIIRYLK